MDDGSIAWMIRGGIHAETREARLQRRAAPCELCGQPTRDRPRAWRERLTSPSGRAADRPPADAARLLPRLTGDPTDMTTDCAHPIPRPRPDHRGGARQVRAGRAGGRGADADRVRPTPRVAARTARPSSASCCTTPPTRASLPEAAVLASLGCGNPTAVAELRAGEIVLDLGSGGGIDVLLSAQRVGPTGFAYGLDMTDEMLDLARRNAAEAGATNVEFRKGRIEAIPLPDASVDVVISNCVVNLSTDKAAVLAEVARVLRPGGRMGISDVVADDAPDPGRARRARQLRRLHRRRPVVRRVPRRAWRRSASTDIAVDADPRRRRRPARRDRPGDQAGRLVAPTGSGRGPAATPLADLPVAGRGRRLLRRRLRLLLTRQS